MNPQVKAKWVAALRSGEFEQGKEALRTPDGYCCLGVLCELHRREVGGAEWKLLHSGNLSYRMGTSYLPHEVLVWAGLEHSWPYVIIDDEKASLDSHNDGSTGYGISRKSFEEIAKAIEDQL